jgi:hypothetical protein
MRHGGPRAALDDPAAKDARVPAAIPPDAGVAGVVGLTVVERNAPARTFRPAIRHEHVPRLVRHGAKRGGKVSVECVVVAQVYDDVGRRSEGADVTLHQCIVGRARQRGHIEPLYAR